MIYIAICIFLLILIMFINIFNDLKETMKIIFISIIYGLLLISLIFLNKISNKNLKIDLLFKEMTIAIFPLVILAKAGIN